MEETLDIVKLIEHNPITRLDKAYQSKLVNKIKAKFDTEEQQLFVASFYCYLNYSKKDFVIDLDSLFKWVGFQSKHKAKELLLKHFIEDVDYKILVTQLGEQVRTNGGSGLNKETIMLNIITFKRFCMKANTNKSTQIHEYFINLEETLHELLDEESSELRQQLANKQYELEQAVENLKKMEQKKNWLLNRRYADAVAGDLIYLYKEFKDDTGTDFIYKVGKTKNIGEREAEYSNTSKSGKIIFVMYCLNCDLTEKVLHHVLDKYRVLRNQEIFEYPDESLFIKTIESIVYVMDSQMGTIEAFIPKLHNLLGIQTQEVIINRIDGGVEEDQQVPEAVVATDVNPTDFNRFVRDCCELSDDFYQPKSEVKQAHRIWSKCSSKDLISKLDKYLHETFQGGTVVDNDIKRNIFKGVKLKPLVYKNKSNEPVDYEQFISEKCKLDYQHRISYVDFFNKFLEWKRITDSNYKLIAKYKKEIQHRLETVFAGGRVHLSGGAKATHLYGVLGVGMEFNNYGLKVPDRTCKMVGQYNMEGDLLQKWDSLSIASRELNIATSSLSNYCRFNNVMNNKVYKYC